MCIIEWQDDLEAADGKRKKWKCQKYKKKVK